MMTRRRRGNCAVYDKNYRFEHRLKPSQNMKTFKTLTLKFSCETVRPLWKYEVKEIDGKTSLRFSFLHISRPLKRTAIVAAAVVWRSAAQWMSRRPRCAFPPRLSFPSRAAAFATRIGLRRRPQLRSVRVSSPPLSVVRDAAALLPCYPGK